MIGLPVGDALLFINYPGIGTQQSGQSLFGSSTRLEIKMTIVNLIHIYGKKNELELKYAFKSALSTQKTIRQILHFAIFHKVSTQLDKYLKGKMFLKYHWTSILI